MKHARLAKVGGRMDQNRESLWAKVLRKKYLSRSFLANTPKVLKAQTPQLGNDLSWYQAPK